ncbi:hypothetical protein [Streptomyces sp. NBC_00328]|uniref:hypothetical protein n=1 Tax=Streptomyces sp. NBC_00328 TaxID=2903646 RepID=UPI002E2CDE38|nr:hypothetical protein [Streptomyces sp. NBC_00328]
MSQKIKATKTRFQDAVVNGDVDGSEDADAENGFDGLDKALRGSDTECRATPDHELVGLRHRLCREVAGPRCPGRVTCRLVLQEAPDLEEFWVWFAPRSGP